MLRNILYFFIFIASSVQAQHDQQDVLLGLSGQSLINDLANQYKPSIILDYNPARDTMFLKVYSFQDTVTCVYTGHKLYLTPGLDPSTVMYNGGGGNGINTEHTYPQSKGAGVGNARSDMHHLFPVRAASNSARSNFPFAEINDNATNRWYYLTLSESSPSFFASNYSELDITIPAFEPREDHKGNAARAVFYFYTMYKEEADNADPTFFAKQVPALCQWHLDDPVDSFEWERNFLIASYQEGKLNPFILDCSLPYRTYCPHLPHNSCFTSNNTLADFGVALYSNYPNPASQGTMVQYELDRTTLVDLHIYNAIGQLIQTVLEEEPQNGGLYQQKFDCSNLPNGVYTYRFVLEQEGVVLNVAKQFIVYR